MSEWNVRLEERHHQAFREIAEETRRTPAGAVRWVLDRYLLLRERHLAAEQAIGRDPDRTT